MTSRALVACVLGAVVAASCGDDARTELMVVLDTTLAVPAEIDVVRIVVTGPKGRMQSATGSLELTRPVLLALVPSGDVLGPVTLQIEAAPADGSDARTATVRTSFVRDRVRELRIVIDESCAPACPALDRPGETLPDWTGTTPSIDGAAPRDLGLETSIPADGGPDGGPAVPDELFVDFVRQIAVEGGASNELVYRMPVTPGGEPRNISAELDAELGTVERTDDRYSNASRDGRWLTFSSGRGDCIDWSCVYRMPTGDASRAEGIYLWMERDWLHSEWPIVDSTGTVIVSGDHVETHSRDVLVVRETADGWERGAVLTLDSPYDQNNVPRFSPDETHVVFLCSNAVYGENDVCEVGLDGTGFRVVARHDEPPAPLVVGDNESLWHPVYEPDGAILFEAEWGGLRQIWRVRPGETEATRVYPAAFDGLTQPCALPDGRIATLTRTPGGDADQISIGSADGRPLFDILVPWEEGQLTYITGCGP